MGTYRVTARPACPVCERPVKNPGVTFGSADGKCLRCGQLVVFIAIEPDTTGDLCLDWLGHEAGAKLVRLLVPELRDNDLETLRHARVTAPGEPAFLAIPVTGRQLWKVREVAERQRGAKDTDRAYWQGEQRNPSRAFGAPTVEALKLL